MSHLLKLIRIWFVDTGFWLTDGTFITKGIVKELAKDTNSEVGSCKKLTGTAKRQNTTYLLGCYHMTATELKRYILDGN
jgi:hypothetical protein